MKIALLFCSMLVASTAFGSSCSSGSLQSYINLGPAGCDLGSISLSNFALATGQNGATEVNPSQVLVTPGGSLSSPTLQFTLSTTVNANNFLESFFRLQASAPMLVGDTLILNSPATSGDGVDTAIEYICPGASFGANSPVGCSNQTSLLTFANASSSQLSDFKSFAPTGFFDTFVDLTADGGLTGSATFSSAAIQFTAVPEPAPVLLPIAGLAMIAVGYRRRIGKSKLT